MKSLQEFKDQLSEEVMSMDTVPREQRYAGHGTVYGQKEVAGVHLLLAVINHLDMNVSESDNLLETVKSITHSSVKVNSRAEMLIV